MKSALSFGSILTLVLSLLFNNTLSAQTTSGLDATTLKSLQRHPKMRGVQSILQPLESGEFETRIVVNLKRPDRIRSLTNLKNSRVRQERNAHVRTRQDRVLANLDNRIVKVTNRFKYIAGFSAKVSTRGLQDILDNPYVISVEPDMILEPHLNQGVSIINAAAVRTTYSGAGTAIAICDTGIDYTHPRLGGGTFPNNKVIGGYDTGQNDADPMDANGHGTACAGIAAGDIGSTGDYIGGVAPDAKLYALKITYATAGGSAYGSDMVEAWEWCITHQNDDPNNPILAISTSFGGGRYYDQGSCDAVSTLMAEAAANAKSAGITIFASSGNDGYCDSLSWPGCMSDVIGVGAVYDADINTYYSCVSAASCAIKYYGRCTSGYYAKDDTQPDMVTSYSNTASFLSLLAPSNRAYTTDITGSGGYNSSGDYVSSFGGTSAACPYSAGAAAVLQSAAYAIDGAYLTPDLVESTLTSTGDSVTDGKVAITKPRVNVDAAVDTLCTTTITYYQDDDADNFGTADVTIEACSQPPGYVTDNSDCDDTNPDINPGATEICNGLDDNCDGDIDEDAKTLFYLDSDGDTYGNPHITTEACNAPSGYVPDNKDCDDSDADEHPNQTWYKDSDGDDYSDGTTDTSSCERPDGYKTAAKLTATSGDCDDEDGAIHPGATEIADDNIDQDCNGSDTITCFVDADQDGHGNDLGETSLAADGSCDTAESESTSSDDCDDFQEDVHPGAIEICNEIDDDCDTEIDDECIESPGLFTIIKTQDGNVVIFYLE